MYLFKQKSFMMPAAAESSSGDGSGVKQNHLDNANECSRNRSRSLPTVIIPEDDDDHNDDESSPISTGVLLPSLTESSDDRRHHEQSRVFSDKERASDPQPQVIRFFCMRCIFAGFFLVLPEKYTRKPQIQWHIM